MPEIKLIEPGFFTPAGWEAHECGVYPKQIRKPGDPWESCIAATGDDPDPEQGGPSAQEQEQIEIASFIAAAPQMARASVKLIEELDIQSSISLDALKYKLELTRALLAAGFKEPA